MDQPEDKPAAFDWQDAQRRYLDACAAFAKSAGAPDPINPWTGALDYWWKSVAPAVTGSEQAMYSNLVNQAKTFFGLGDQFGRMLAAAAAARDGENDWVAVMNRQLDALKAAVGGAGAAAGQGPQSPAAFWQLPADTWERTLSSLSAMPGDMFRAFKLETGMPAADRFPSVPGLGYTKEMQDQLQHCARLWAEYQKQLVEYQALLSAAGVHAVEKLRERILRLGAEQKKITSLRQIYDLWVDCNEDAYAELVYSKEYSEQYGRMVNALMAFKRHAQMLVDEGLGALNMPTQRAMETMQQRQQEIRRDLRAAEARQQADADALQALKRELEALKRELKQGGARPDAAAAPDKPVRQKRPKPSGPAAEEHR